MTTTPSDWRSAAPASSASASGSIPAIIATVVIKIGRNRVSAAMTIARSFECPASRERLANSTRRMPFFTTRPISKTVPISEKRLSVSWVSASAPSAPMIASGTAKRMIAGDR